jgi:hypothetical protein
MSPQDVTVTGDHPPVPVRVYPGVSVGYRLVPGFGDRHAQRAPDAVRFPLPLDDCERAWA